MNWELIESFGVRSDLNDTIHYNEGHKKFYDDPNDELLGTFRDPDEWRWLRYESGIGL